MKISYTVEQMIAVLKIHQANNYNLLKTSRESGVSRNTLRRWIDSMGSQVFRKSVLIQEIAFKADVKEVDRRAKLASAIIDRQTEIVDRMEKRIAKSKSLYELARTLKILHEVDLNNQSLMPDGSIEDNGEVDFIQQVHDALVRNAQNKLPSLT